MFATVEATGSVTFSIPINSVKEGLQRLKKNGKLERGFVGAHIKDVTPRVTEKFKLSAKSGACVYELTLPPGKFVSPTKAAGLLPGDVVIRYGDAEIDRARTLARAVLNTKPGTAVVVTFHRGKTLLRRTLKVGQR